jgi:hypothetical protein
MSVFHATFCAGLTLHDTGGAAEAGATPLASRPLNCGQSLFRGWARRPADSRVSRQVIRAA